MPRRGENIYKRKDGRWEGRYVRGVDTVSGEKIWGSVYSREYQDCRRRLQAAQAEVLLTARRGVEKRFGEWLDEWLEERRAELKHATYVVYHNQVEWHIKPALAALELGQMTGDVIQRYMSEKLSGGRLDGAGGLSASTVQLQRHIISAALEDARRRGLLDVRPAVPLRRGKGREKHVAVYSMEEQLRLTAALKTMSRENPSYLGLLLSLHTGLRVGELAALQWRDVSFEDGLIYVRRTLQRIANPDRAPGAPKTCIVLGPPKTANAQRLLPMTRELAALLQAYFGTLPPDARRADAFLFQNQGKCVEPRTFERYHERAALAAQVTKLKFHALRHTFATRAIEAGMDAKALSEILGHSNVQITLNLYVHSLMDHKRRAMDLLQRYIDIDPERTA